MPTEIKKEIQLEIAHVLFIDIVGYSKLLIDEQHALLETLNQIVRGTEQFRNAEKAAKLIKIPTGDGMALVFQDRLEAPAECALEISRALKEHPILPLRMGIHSGPVSGVIDVNGRANVAGAGINMAQRVMECGDAGHILLSKHVAEDLEQFARWKPLLHDLGECEVKHGVRVHIMNLHTEERGNPEAPEKFRHLRGKKRIGPPVSASTLKAVRPSWAMIVAAILVVAMVAVGIVIFLQRAPTKRGALSPAGIAEKSIAVLPFENLSDDKANAYFATGIQDEILTRLAKIGALKVISHTSTQQYSARPGNLPEIARQLGVANILEGSVQRVADQAHINVQLIRAATDEHLWAESYDRKLESIFGVEAEVATAIADALKAKLTGAEQQALEQKPTNNPQAYDAYLRGITLWRDNNFLVRLKAIQPLEEAVRLDPDFALAWAQLARAKSLVFRSDATSERREDAQRSLNTALKLKPDLPETHLAKGYFQLWVLSDLDAARQTFDQLRPKLPNSADTPEALYIINFRQGRWDEARANTDEAIRLNPLDRIVREEHAWIRFVTRDFSAALRYCDEALKLWPDDTAFLDDEAQIYQRLGQLDQAESFLNKLRITPESIDGVYTVCYQAILRRRPAGAIPVLQSWLDRANSLPWWRSDYRGNLGDLQRLSGDQAAAKTTYSQARDELERALKEQPANALWIYRALADIYAGLGDRDRALSSVDRAISMEKESANINANVINEDTRARIEARFGMKDLAIPALEHLLKTSYSDPLTPALLRLDPDFDPLRGDPRFEKLAHSDGK